MAKIHGIDGSAAGEVKLPKVFSTPFRPDLIQRAFLAIQSNKRQAYGTNLLAGQRTSAHYHGVKDKRYSMKNKEMARAPRSHESSPAQQLRARFAPHTVSGRRAHPPKVEKIWHQKVNRKENALAIRSAIAATGSADIVSKRHKISGLILPIIVTDKMQDIQKTGNLKKILFSFGCKEDLKRAENRKVRAGKGKMRGRKMKGKKSVLIVVADDKGVVKAARNLSGVEICNVKDLNVKILAPGAQAGRLTVWSESSIKKLGEIYG
jgi:large subunit ribosomal protein L4e